MRSTVAIQAHGVNAVSHVLQSGQPAAQNVVQEEEEKLKKNMEALAAAAVGLQEKKRRDVDKKLKDAAKEALLSVDNQVKKRYARTGRKQIRQLARGALRWLNVLVHDNICTAINNARRLEDIVRILGVNGVHKWPVIDRFVDPSLWLSGQQEDSSAKAGRDRLVYIG